MTLIDDRGRLFGTVNVIDALVVLFVLGGDDQPQSKHSEINPETPPQQ